MVNPAAGVAPSHATFHPASTFATAGVHVLHTKDCTPERTVHAASSYNWPYAQDMLADCVHVREYPCDPDATHAPFEGKLTTVQPSVQLLALLHWDTYVPKGGGVDEEEPSTNVWSAAMLCADTKITRR